MKTLITIIFLLFSIAAFAQVGSQSVSGVKFRVLDSATYRTAATAAHTQGYADIYWNQQATNKHYDIWNGSSYDHVFSFGGGMVGAGNGLYKDGDSISVGGVVSKDIDLISYNNKRLYYVGTDGTDSSGVFIFKGGSGLFVSMSNSNGGGILSVQPSHVQITSISPSGAVTYEADDSGLTASIDSLGNVDYHIARGFFSIETGAPNVERLRIENDGSWSIGGNNGTTGQVLTSQGSTSPPIWTSNSGTYTPTLTNTTNVAASTAYVTGWYRVGAMVTVFGKVDIDATLAASSATELGVSLPVASNMTGEQDLGGTAISDSIASLAARIKGDATNDRASIVFKAISLTNDSYSFEFSYQVK